MNQKAVFLDIDNTIIKGTTVNILVRYCYKINILSLKLVARALYWYLLYKLNFIKDFSKIVDKTSFIMNDILQKLPAEEINKIMEQCFEKEIVPKIYLQTKALMDKFNKEGYKIFLISSTLQPLAELLQLHLGYGTVVATEIEKNEGYYTGKIKGAVCFGNEKLRRIEEINKAEHIDFQQSYAFSDHISDIPMLERVGKAILVNPSRKFGKIAKKRGWEVMKVSL